jgi:hypothetical protein
VSVLGLVRSRPNHGVWTLFPGAAPETPFQSHLPNRHRLSTICFAYTAGELGTPISQSRILLSATVSKQTLMFLSLLLFGEDYWGSG